MSAPKRAAFVVSLLVLVVGLIGQMLFWPRWARPQRPPSDLPESAGHRAVWQDGDPASPQDGDKLLEVVFNDPTPFAPHYAEPLRQAAVMAERADAALLVSLENVSVSPPAEDDMRFLSNGRARVEDVLMNRPGWPIAVGATLPANGGFGGNRTRVRRVNGVQVVERSVFRRVPRDGGRYLVFLHRTRDGLVVANFGYGNAFEIRGSRLVAMSVPDHGTWQQSSDTARTLTLVRALGARPAVSSAVWGPPPPGLAP